jgi:dTDP-4-amino-4,6-dideoxygalactose transaminase
MSRVPVAVPTRLGEAERGPIQEAMCRVLGSGTWVLGDEVAAFEAEFANFVGAAEVVGVGNGTDALTIALDAFALPRGAEVLVSPNDGGFGAVATRSAGLCPVVMDLDPASLCPTVTQAARVATKTTAAVIVTHLHGNALDLAEIDEWRRSRGLVLIEDCAQAHGLRVDGRHVGTTGDAATYSFYPTKNLGAAGDGGAITFSPTSPAPAGRARSLRHYGWVESFRAELPGGRNSRLDELQAAILRVRLEHLDERNERRVAVAELYRSVLALNGRAALLAEPLRTVAHHAVVLTGSRDERESLAGHLDQLGIDTAVHYPWLVSEMPGVGCSSSALDVAAELRERILSLPCAAELTEDEVSRVASGLECWAG